MQDLHEIEAIKRLKYRYMRCLDLKRWDELTDCFTEDATAAYGDGKFSFDNRAAIMEFLRNALSGSNMLYSHRVHQPEIDLTSPTTATGSWALDDVVIELYSNTTIRGAAFYEDRYVKIGGLWKIQHTGYARVFEEVVSRKDTPSLQLSANRWATSSD